MGHCTLLTIPVYSLLSALRLRAKESCPIPRPLAVNRSRPRCYWWDGGPPRTTDVLRHTPPPPLLLVGWRTPENNGRAPPHPRTRAQRHTLTLRARCKHTAPRALEHLVGEHGLELTHSGAKRSDLVLKIKHAAD